MPVPAAPNLQDLIDLSREYWKGSEMISVVERLIESWLDSQTERRYQPAFIQLLVSEGWSVLHNTRHSPIEPGKDVIARDPSGVLHCFQLKGNPGSRVTKTVAQGLLQQLIELLELPPARVYRSSTRERHVAVFVTNGEIDEEARLVLEGVGARAGTPQCPARSFEVWSRGILASRFLRAAGRVWPTSLEGTRLVLDFMARDGCEIPDPQAISKILTSTAPTPSRKTSNAAKTANLAALLLLTEIVKSRLYAVENHYGLYLTSVLASVQALRFADSTKRLASVIQYASLCLEHCADLIAEAQTRRFDPDLLWAQRDPLAEFDIMWERRRLVGDCAATLVLGGTTDVRYDQSYAAKVIEATFRQPRLWGLAAVPALIVRYWAACRVHAGADTERDLGAQLRAILAASAEQPGGVRPLASPYYGFTDCWAYSNQIRYFAGDSIFTDSFKGQIWFARAMLFMLAKRNRKQTCKALWPSFSQVIHVEPDLPTSAFFDSVPARDGKMRNYTFHRKEWIELVEEAINDSEGAFLEPFATLAWLIAAYVAIVPYRAWTGVLIWLDTKLNVTWYRPDHLPTR
jgi:hypothetical protein